jgi:conjugative relaxase-like TrwC/TraI family protein
LPLLTLAKLGPGAVEYFEQMVARGVEEYYLNAKEAPGQWLGDSLEHLGLDGTVDGDEFHRVLAHAHPADGTRLTDGKSEPKVVGFDATFGAPKSASLLFALGPRAASNEVRNAHDIAVREAFDVLQSLARGRRDHAGSRLVAGDGLVAAAYRHRTSRAAEPHLHTHVVIANLVYAPEDRRWSALDARPLYSWCKPVGYLYNAQLRYELTTRLGVRWSRAAKGMAEIDGFDTKVLRAFSTRRRDIESDLDATGRSGAKAAQKAAYRTRKPKNLDLDGEGLLALWEQRAADHGLDRRGFAKILNHPRVALVPTVGTQEADALYRWLARPDALTAKRSTFDVRHVIEAICEALPDGGRVQDVLALADGFLSSAHVIALDIDDRPTLRRNDGQLVPSGDALVRFTTPEMVATEQRLLVRAAERRDERSGIVRHEPTEAALVAARMLSDEQSRMVRTLCGSGAGIDIVEGVAGSGKTTALAVAAQAWTGCGYRVHGCALAARAAARLEDATAIPSCSLDRLLRSVARGEIRLGARDVVIVDEAAMVGSRKLHELFDHTDRACAKVVLIGDPRQLPEIDAGGAFAALQRMLGGPVLSLNRRQRESWERDALRQLRDGDTDLALDAYRTHGQVHEPDDARGAMVDAWLHARAVGDDVIMLAPTIAAVEDLNRRARHQLQAVGALGPDQIELGGRRFAIGDEVLALRNAYDMDVLNGSRFTIERIDIRRHELHCADSSGQIASVSFGYADAGHLAHAYAMTIHKAQGATVEHALVLVDETMASEHAYTALSRARGRTDLFVDFGTSIEHEAHAPPPSSTVTSDRLAATVNRSAAQRLAIDQTPMPLVPLEALREERSQLQQQLANRPSDNSIVLRRLGERISSTRQSLEQAQWRRDNAQQKLEQLGPVRRRVHRRDRVQIERLEQSAADNIERLTAELTPMTLRHGALTRTQRERTRWEQQHQPELDRVVELDRAIRMHEVASRSPGIEPPTRTRGVEPGLELGL